MEVLERLHPAHDIAAPDGDIGLLAAVRALADGPLAALAADIDRCGVYPKSVLQRLGELGGLSAHIDTPGHPADYGLAIQAMTDISRVCGATGFMVWCHDVCGVYMAQSGNPHLMGEALHRHNRGDTLGATGMSNPMKTFAGIETFLLHAKKWMVVTASTARCPGSATSAQTIILERSLTSKARTQQLPKQK